LREVAIPFVIAVLPAAGQPLSAFGLRSLPYSKVCSSKAGGKKIFIKLILYDRSAGRSFFLHHPDNPVILSKNKSSREHSKRDLFLREEKFSNS
jgi:hypothetical protein